MKKVVNWIMKFFVNVKTKKNCFSWYTCYSFFNFGYFLYIKKEIFKHFYNNNKSSKITLDDIQIFNYSIIINKSLLELCDIVRQKEGKYKSNYNCNFCVIYSLIMKKYVQNVITKLKN